MKHGSGESSVRKFRTSVANYDCAPPHLRNAIISSTQNANISAITKISKSFQYGVKGFAFFKRNETRHILNKHHFGHECGHETQVFLKKVIALVFFGTDGGVY